MKRSAIILTAIVIFLSSFGCNNAEIKYGYGNDYESDPQIKQDTDMDRDRVKFYH
jgi:hypothetical protein